MINCAKVVIRNRNELDRRFASYGIEYKIDHIIDKMKIIYVNDDKENQRIRLLGVENQYNLQEYTDSETGEVTTQEIKTKNVKKVQIYVMKKKQYEKLVPFEKELVMKDMNTIVALIHQLQAIREIEVLERMWQTGDYKLSDDFNFDINDM